MTLEQVAGAVVEHLRPALRAAMASDRRGPLHVSGRATAARLLDPRYSVGHVVLHAPYGAWREPCFVLSRPGRQLLAEGYSAGVMRVIYDHDRQAQGILDRVFFGYPLHRAVYDRLQILVDRLRPELEARLRRRGRLRIFSAPSGFAYDLIRPLEAIIAADPGAARRIELVAADLDPHGVLAPELKARADRLGVKFRMILGDITAEATRAEIASGGPYQVALFVGLSSWLPKPLTVAHLTWLRGQLAPDAVLVTDCFSADTYAEGGRYAGYRASYYSPAAYQALLEWCGYAGLEAVATSGRDRINHVFLSRARAGRREPARTG